MLTGEEIIKAVEEGKIVIEPFDKSNVNPNSYNLTLSDELIVYTDDLLDCRKENKTRKIKVPKEGYTLSPNTLYLARTNEYTENEVYVPQISGRSSIGRIGLTVHLCAGCGAIGFKGTWTLGITCVTPTKIYPNMEIGQIYYFPLIGENNIKYTGNYNNESEIKTSKMHIDFEEKQLMKKNSDE